MISHATPILLILSLGCATSFAQERTPYGVWLRDDGNSIVRIAPCGSNICAINLQIKDTSKGEEVGDRLVMSLKQVSSNEWTGTAYDLRKSAFDLSGID
jgi:uncharacterized protein (DUF2147 family)